jgi:hypothetical protein
MNSKNTVCNKVVVFSVPEVAPITFNVLKGGIRQGMVFIQKDLN